MIVGDPYRIKDIIRLSKIRDWSYLKTQKFYSKWQVIREKQSRTNHFPTIMRYFKQIDKLFKEYKI